MKDRGSALMKVGNRTKEDLQERGEIRCDYHEVLTKYELKSLQISYNEASYLNEMVTLVDVQHTDFCRERIYICA